MEKVSIQLLAYILHFTGYKCWWVKLVCKTWYKATTLHTYKLVYEEFAKDLVKEYKIENYIMYPEIFGKNPDLKIPVPREFAGKRVGTRIINNCFIYEGEFMDGKMHGQGFLYKKERGLIYEGEFQDNEYSGNGTAYNYFGFSYIRNYCVFYVRGTYKGQFVKGARSGWGSMYYIDGTSFTGIWKENYYKKGSFKYIDGTIFEGTFTINGYGDYNSIGIYKYTDGKILEGPFEWDR